MGEIVFRKIYFIRYYIFDYEKEMIDMLKIYVWPFSNLNSWIHRIEKWIHAKKIFATRRG